MGKRKNRFEDEIPFAREFESREEHCRGCFEQDGDWCDEVLTDDDFSVRRAWVVVEMGCSGGVEDFFDDEPCDEFDDRLPWDPDPCDEEDGGEEDDDWTEEENERFRGMFPNMEDDEDVEEDLSGYDIHNPHDLGKLGERLAARYLKRRKCKILERNYRCEYGEADLICFDHGTVVLVEVKTRLGNSVRPEEAVDVEKVSTYRDITLKYTWDNKWFNSVRLDVVAINVENPHKAHVHHFVGVCEWLN